MVGRSLTSFNNVESTSMSGRALSLSHPRTYGSVSKAGADTRFSVCVSHYPELDNLNVQVPSGSQTATGSSLRQPRSAW